MNAPLEIVGNSETTSIYRVHRIKQAINPQT